MSLKRGNTIELENSLYNKIRIASKLNNQTITSFVLDAINTELKSMQRKYNRNNKKDNIYNDKEERGSTIELRKDFYNRIKIVSKIEGKTILQFIYDSLEGIISSIELKYAQMILDNYKENNNE